MRNPAGDCFRRKARGFQQHPTVPCPRNLAIRLRNRKTNYPGARTGAGQGAGDCGVNATAQYVLLDRHQQPRSGCNNVVKVDFVEWLDAGNADDTDINAVQCKRFGGEKTG